MNENNFNFSFQNLFLTNLITFYILYENPFKKLYIDFVTKFFFLFTVVFFFFFLLYEAVKIVVVDDITSIASSPKPQTTLIVYSVPGERFLNIANFELDFSFTFSILFFFGKLIFLNFEIKFKK